MPRMMDLHRLWRSLLSPGPRCHLSSLTNTCGRELVGPFDDGAILHPWRRHDGSLPDTEAVKIEGEGQRALGIVVRVGHASNGRSIPGCYVIAAEAALRDVVDGAE
jgi:hypothetical protein